VKWRPQMTVGQAGKIAVWQDTGTGIAGARLLRLQNVTIQAVGESINNYVLSQPVAVSGRFYIGFSTIAGPGLFGLSYQLASGVPADTVFQTGGMPMNFNNLAAQLISDTSLGGSSGYFALRAVGARTGFTYQGKLEENGMSANGNYDMWFRIFNGAGSAQLGSDLFVYNVPVVDGLFTTRVPVDPTVLYNETTDPQLEILVRPAGGFFYNILSPRQRVSQAPSAMVAHIAQEARGISNFAQAGAPFLVNAGDWGQGINSYQPGAGLIVSASANSYINMLAPNNAETGVLFGKPTGGTANAGIVHNNASSNSLQFRTGGNNTRMTIRGDGFVGVGRDAQISGAEVFGVGTNYGSGLFGGMYVSTSAGGYPFYGYSVGGGITAYSWVQPSTNTWRLTYGNDNFVISNTGLVGIGTGSPSAGGYRLELPNIAGPAGQGRANAWVTYSSRELKENIQTLADPIETLRKLRGVSFDWKTALADGSHKHDIGFIAEEVGAVLPELVTRTSNGAATGLDYGRVVPVTVEAIKQQQTQLDAMQAENAELRARLEKLEAALQK
jgi:hypothetical protein